MFVNVMNFAFHALVSRRIGVAAYGSLNALIAGFTLFSSPAIILTTVVVKYAAEFKALGDSAKLRSFASRVLLGLSVAASLVIAIGFLLAGTIANYLHLAHAAPVMLVVLILALNIVLPIRGLLQGTEAFGPYALSLSSEAGAKTVLAVALTGTIGLGLSGALLGWVLALILSALYTCAVLWRRYRGVRSEKLNLDFRRLARTSAGVTVATVLITSLGFSDVVIVKHFFDARSAGLYAAASLSGKMLYFLVNFVPAVLLPRAANLSLSGQSAVPVLRQAITVVLVMAASALFVYYRFPAAVVGTLAGASFVPAAPLLFQYGMGITLFATLNTVVFYKMAIHRFDFLIPLAVLAVAELVAIYLYHGSSFQVIHILIATNALALVAALYRINVPIQVGARTLEPAQS